MGELAHTCPSCRLSNQTVHSQDMRFRWPQEQACERGEDLGVRFKRVPVAPILATLGGARIEQETVEQVKDKTEARLRSTFYCSTVQASLAYTRVFGFCWHAQINP